MAPHCDTLDGPVVKAAIKALDSGNVNLILPWVPKKAVTELRQAFKKTLHVRKQGKQSREVADLWFFETAVRLHREGEGKSYTGLKSAGLDWGPVVPKAEMAIEKGDARQVITLLTKTVKDELEERFQHAIRLDTLVDYQDYQAVLTMTDKRSPIIIQQGSYNKVGDSLSTE